MATTQRRLEGYRAALSAAGVDVDDDLICTGIHAEADASAAVAALGRSPTRRPRCSLPTRPARLPWSRFCRHRRRNRSRSSGSVTSRSRPRCSCRSPSSTRIRTTSGRSPPPGCSPVPTSPVNACAAARPCPSAWSCGARVGRTDESVRRPVPRPLQTPKTGVGAPTGSGLFVVPADGDGPSPRNSGACGSRGRRGSRAAEPCQVDVGAGGGSTPGTQCCGVPARRAARAIPPHRSLSGDDVRRSACRGRGCSSG